MKLKRNYTIIGLSTIFIIFLPGCSSVPKSALVKPDEAMNQEKLILNLSDRVQALEERISDLKTRMDSSRASIPSVGTQLNLESKKIEEIAVIAHPSENTGIPITSIPTSFDSEAGFINNDAIQSFRKSMALYRIEKYPESVLSFSDFIGKYPDHILAGSAQFYIGECYLKQKEYKLSIQEFQSVLSSYGQSSHISDSLKEIAFAEDVLKDKKNAAHHRQILSSVFPQSPAANARIMQDEIKSSAAVPILINSEQSPKIPQSTPYLDAPPTPQSAPLTAPINGLEKEEKN